MEIEPIKLFFLESTETPHSGFGYSLEEFREDFKNRQPDLFHLTRFDVDRIMSGHAASFQMYFQAFYRCLDGVILFHPENFNYNKPRIWTSGSYCISIPGNSPVQFIVAPLGEYYKNGNHATLSVLECVFFSFSIWKTITTVVPNRA